MSGHDAPLKGPHQGQPVLTAGSPLDRAAAAMVLIHGRGGAAHDGPGRPIAGRPAAGAQAGRRKGKMQGFFELRLVRRYRRTEPTLRSNKIVKDVVGQMERLATVERFLSGS